MKLNKRSIKLTAGMLGCFALLAVCARLSDGVMPASAHCFTSSSPGSEMAGLPASDTRAQVSPAKIRSTII